MFQKLFTLIAVSAILILGSPAAMAKLNSGIPILDGTVVCAHGSFHSYSLMPAKGDKLTINADKLINAKKAKILSFSPKKKIPGPPPYVPVMVPFKLNSQPGEKQRAVYSYRLISRDERAGGMQVTIDIHKPPVKSKKWRVYVIYQSRGIVHGIAILEALAKK